MMYKHTFTVFTPTYNRAHTLHRVHKSLMTQTYRNFEWIIVDDGSTDDTKELVIKWQNEADYPIRYIWQSNSGKNIAVNRGVSEASGELFLIIDSDDALVPIALERFKFHWDSIPEDEKKGFSGVTCHCLDDRGKFIGTKFPFDPTDSNPLEIHFKHNVRGEKCGFQRTEILRQFPYPIFEGEKFIPQSLVWNRIAGQFKTRYVNEALRIYHFSPNSLSTASVRIKNPNGTRYYYKELLNFKCIIPRKHLIKNYVNYVRYSFHGGIGVVRQVRDIRSTFYWLTALPGGYLAYLRDKILNLR